MKTHRRLWDQFISAENFDLAVKNAVRGKKSKSAINRFMKNRQENLAALRDMLERGTFTTSHYREKTVYEPKKRQIYILPFYPDHIVHHALINVLGPIWLKMFVADSYACIPGRGLYSASRRLMDFMRSYDYVVQCDIRKFYPNMDHKIMMDIIKRKIGDRRILALMENIVWSTGGDKNIPIGNLTSQWLGNVYLNELDHYVKQTLYWRGYIRYCDDFCFFGNDKRQLQDIAHQVENFLLAKLGLTFSKCNLQPTRLGVDYLGYRHFKEFILVRKRTARRVKNRLVNIKIYNDKSERARGQIAAAHGWLKWANTYNYQKSVARYIDRELHKTAAKNTS